ncbi:MAG: hypothetical protein KKE20_04970 [Nanoarchaeota archaeon]|nr:hypothetical protein [Nanoarchaeota archaeon]
MLGKKSNIAFVILGVILFMIIFYVIFVNATKECSQDSHCGEERYCGSDFKCHDMKIIQKSYVTNEYQLWKASFIIGAAIIIAAIILRRKKG